MIQKTLQKKVSVKIGNGKLKRKRSFDFSLYLWLPSRKGRWILLLPKGNQKRGGLPVDNCCEEKLTYFL